MSLFQRRKRVPWNIKKYLYLAHDITGMLLNKERQHQDRRVEQLTWLLAIIIILLIISIGINIYLIQ